MDPIHWYPGHMAKAKRELNELVRYLDVLIEIRDARLPLSSHNRDLDPILNKRPTIILLNKTDLAAPTITRAWVSWLRQHSLSVLEVNGKNGSGTDKIWPVLAKVNTKGLRRGIRVGVVGIPNVGKSSILNRLLGIGSAKTGNRPGVTRGKQWIRKQGIDILDTPGLLPLKIDDQLAGKKLALIGTIREEIISGYDLALFLLEQYGEALFDWRGQQLDFETMEAALDWYAAKRGFRIKGGALDLNRAVTAILQEFRNGRLGRISLECPPATGEQDG